MASITGVVYDITRMTVITGATVSAYLASDQPMILTLSDGTAVAPVGAPVADDVTGTLGAYVLNSLTLDTLYHLYVEPKDGPPFWLLNRVPDPEPLVSPCVLTGRVLDPTADFVYAFLESPSEVSGGLYINQGTVYAMLSPQGTFSLALWPTLALTPPSLYRVVIGKTTYRGSIPSLPEISLKDWAALTSTLRIT